MSKNMCSNIKMPGDVPVKKIPLLANFDFVFHFFISFVKYMYRYGKNGPIKIASNIIFFHTLMKKPTKIHI